MTYRIEISQSALEDIVEATEFIAKDSKLAAHRWLQSLQQRFHDVQAMPTQFGLIAEAESLGRSYRSFVHFSHRVIYRIDEEMLTVFVVRVYHGARRPLSQSDLNKQR